MTTTLLGLVLVCLAIFQPPKTSDDSQPAQKIPRTMLDTKPVSLREMTKRADRIFFGTVVSVEEKMEKLPSSEKDSLIRYTTFKVEEVIKPSKEEDQQAQKLIKGELYTVKQYSNLSRPVKNGDKLLWYLAPTSKQGLTQPVGVDSGHFHIIKNAEGGLQAINLKANENLMDVDAVKDDVNTLMSFLPNTDRASFETDVQKWATKAEKRQTGQPAPLDLVIARTKKLLSDK